MLGGSELRNDVRPTSEFKAWSETKLFATYDLVIYSMAVMTQMARREAILEGKPSISL